MRPTIVLSAVVCFSIPYTIAAAQTQCVSFSDSIDGVNKDRTVEKSLNGEVELRDAASGKLVRSFEGHSSSFEGHPNRVSSVAFSPDGRQVLWGSTWDNTVKLWDTASPKLVRSFEGQIRGKM